jgi:MoxR-like ATPase
MNTNTQLKVVRNKKKTDELNTAVGRVKALEDGLNSIVLERKDEVSSSITAIIAGLNVLLLGPPGTAKSYLVNAIARALMWTYFEILMNPTTEPNELLGGFDLIELGKGRYVRESTGMITEAELVFLDEAYKSNSACLNLLLPIMNERRCKVKGEMIDLPTKCIFGASNEVPGPEDGLGAVHDRWAVKHWVTPLQMKANKKRVMWGRIPAIADVFNGSSPAVSRDDIVALQSAAKLVTVSDEIEEATAKIQQMLLAKESIVLSDRKTVQWGLFLKAQAAKKGKTEVELEDIASSACMLWSEPEQVEAVKLIVGETACPWMVKISQGERIISEQELNLEDLAIQSDEHRISPLEVQKKATALQDIVSTEWKRLEDVKRDHKGKATDLIDNLKYRVKEFQSEVTRLSQIV